MIGLDTNVVVRYIVQDDPAQSRVASRLIESLTPEAAGFVSIVTLAEITWVLDAAYGARRDKSPMSSRICCRHKPWLYNWPRLRGKRWRTIAKAQPIMPIASLSGWAPPMIARRRTRLTKSPYATPVCDGWNISNKPDGDIQAWANVNQSTYAMTVITGDGHHWNVAPGFLKKASDKTTGQADSERSARSSNPASNNVIPLKPP